jgi:hypothetical protein
VWKSTRNFSEDSWSPSGDLNSGPAENKAGVVNTGMRRSSTSFGDGRDVAAGIPVTCSGVVGFQTRAE